MNRRRQDGIAAVEFAIIAFALLWTIFGVIDLSRIYFTVAVLDDVTRRGARLAAVCPVNDGAVAEIAVLNFNGGTASPLVNGLDASHILVEYLDEDGAQVPQPATTGYGSIEFVRVRINNQAGGFQIQTLIPGMSGLIVPPQFQTTMPRESLGFPRGGVAPVAC